jgi:cholesterol 7-dehydrogenase
MWEYLEENLYLVLLVFAVAYFLYYRKYAFYVYYQHSTFKKGQRFLGKTLPSFPNSWYCVMKTDDLKKGDTKYIDYFGQNIALFRGDNGKVYAVDAYCAHMGANLAIGGKVKYGKCIQCPFHGWVFDGETGYSVLGPDMKIREAEKYKYNETVGTCDHKGEAFKCIGKEKVQIRTWVTREMCGFIFVWYHAMEEFRTKPQYEPLDVTEFINRTSYRGYSRNIIESHVQDIPENGGDLMHFFYVHTQLIPGTDLLRATWRSKWLPADTPDLREQMSHEVEYVNKFKKEIFDKYLTKENSKYIGVLNLDMYAILPGGKKFFFFNATGLQVGGGLVYLFLKSPFFETLFFQTVVSLQRYKHEMFMHIYTSSYMPYWATALKLRLETQQVMNDGVVWDNKKFGMETYYNMKSEPDKMLFDWRTWYSQFYEGCRETEEAREKYNW